MNENRFNGMGKIYSKYRPSYPLAFIDYLKKEVGVSIDSIVADIGSGTGILTKQLLTENICVYAVEPNDDMRKVAENDLSNHSNFISVNGTAENTTLNDYSVDFITVAQAFHWFDRSKFKYECKRILKPQGKVILVYNSRDNQSNLVLENDEINRKYLPEFKGFSGEMRNAEKEDDYSNFFSGDYEIKVFSNDLVYDEQEFIGRNLSSSHSVKEGDGNYNPYIYRLKELFDKYKEDEKVIIGSFTRSYVGIV